MASVENIFDPVHYGNVRRPAMEAETLPPWCYTSQAFYDREVEAIFKKTWNFLGREDEVPNHGDYMTFDLFGESVMVLRDKDGTVRAFANICRHRGTRLLDGCGNRRSITCPYHSWAYALNGDLIGAGGMEQTVGFDKGDFGLVPIRLETWAGFIFVTFDAATESLADHLGDLPDLVASHDLANMVCMRRKEFDLSCNWKIYLENAMEEYHTPTVHRQSIGKQATLRIDAAGQWDGMHMPTADTIGVLKEDLGNAFPHIAGLNEQAAGGTYFLAIYPSTFFAVTQDCMWWLQPFPSGPDGMKLVAGACFPKSTVARDDFAEKAERYYYRWDKSVPEDNDISERQQAGIGSDLATPGRLSIYETVVHDIANWVLDRTLD